MKYSRSELRKIIMTILYQVFMYESSKINYSLDEIIDNQIEVKNDFVINTVNGILENKDKLFDIANKYLIDWSMNRLGKIDQAILCIGIYELLYTDTPEIVCINEAIELSKQYSDDKVRKMINGVLDKVLKEKEEN